MRPFHVQVFAVLLLLFFHPPVVSAQDSSPDPAATPEALIAEARFLDHCLENHTRARSFYRKGIEAGAKKKLLGEALYRIARSHYIDGKSAKTEKVLEELLELRYESGMRPWPKRARTALEVLYTENDPFRIEARGTGEYTISKTAAPLREVLLELRAQADIGVVIDTDTPQPWTVSVDLSELTLADMLDRLVGPEQNRKIADGAYAIGPVAKDGGAWLRSFRYQDLRARKDRALCGILRTRHVNLSMPDLKLGQALQMLEEQCKVPLRLETGALAAAHSRIVVWVEHLSIDVALDMIVVPVGLTWRVEGGEIVIGEPDASEESK